jgi:hypothetical protein
MIKNFILLKILIIFLNSFNCQLPIGNVIKTRPVIDIFDLFGRTNSEASYSIS